MQSAERAGPLRADEFDPARAAAGPTGWSAPGGTVRAEPLSVAANTYRTNSPTTPRNVRPANESIESAKSLGLTLFDIGRVLELADTGERPCGRVEAMVDAKVAEIDQRIVELQVLRARLCSLDASPGGESSVCPIIEHAR